MSDLQHHTIGNFLKLTLFLSLCIQGVFAQDSALTRSFKVSAYVETYYCYDIAKPENHERAFVYNHKRHNEVNINLALIKAEYSQERVRAALALMGGTYAQYNMAAEPELLRNIYEANVGIKLSSKHNFWLDAGVFSSHLGFESAIGMDNRTLTRSLAAENSPYYECGVKLNYTSKNEKFYVAFMYLNGWQRIQRPDGNSTPAFGSHLIYRANEKLNINWCTFSGNDFPDSLRRWRHFTDIYISYAINSKLNLLAGFDIGRQQQKKSSSTYDLWYAPTFIMKYIPTKKISLAARAEYYADEKQVIVYTGTPNGYQTQGYSLNMDYSPFNNVMLRLEGRTFISKDEIFMLDKKADNRNYFFTAALAIKF